MLSMIIALALGIAVGVAAFSTWNMIWGILCGIAVIVAVQFGIGWLLRRKVGAVQQKMQLLLSESQAKLSRKIQLMQQRPGTNVKAAQQMLEKEQAQAVRDAMALTVLFKPYYWWSPMLRRQVNTMNMVFHYQLKEFEAVDALLPKCLFYDPQSIAMKMARMYKKEDPKLEKFFKSKTRRLKGNDCALVYATYAWIKVKQDKVDDAIACLIEAKKKSTHPAVVENWERLVNGKVKNFSNAALGDNWYALYLEEPKVRPQRVVKQYH